MSSCVDADFSALADVVVIVDIVAATIIAISVHRLVAAVTLIGVLPSFGLEIKPHPY
jgi:hypothetical protein